jgi:hypothetical protein
LSASGGFIIRKNSSFLVILVSKIEKTLSFFEKIPQNPQKPEISAKLARLRRVCVTCGIAICG